MRTFRGAAVGLAALVAVAAGPATAGAQRSLLIERFDATITVGEDGWIDVREEIRVRFTGSWNGIFRNVPVEYRTPQGFSYRLQLSDIEVRGGDSQPLEYWDKRVRHYRQLKIRVPGARDATQTVVIRYRIPNALKFWDEYEELYWNVTGDEWEMPINAATATVLLPDGLEGLRTASWTGGYGSTENAATVTEIEDGFYFEMARRLNYREGMTVAIAWNPGVVDRPTAFDKAVLFVRANWLLIFPLLSFGIMWRLWDVRGRDPRRHPIAPQYAPPDGLTPAEAGTLIDGRPDMRDITAALVDLAVRGYIRIEEIEMTGVLKWFGSKDYWIALARPRDSWKELKTHERHLLNGVLDDFGERVKLSSLKHEFYVHLPTIRSAIYDALMEHRFYHRRPDETLEAYVALGFVVAVVGVAGGILASSVLVMSKLTAILAGVGSALPVWGFGIFMPAKTTRGARALERVLGFEEFLDRVESDRFERIEKTPEMFEKYLPYAMAFGVEDHWAKAFEGMFTEPPDWYSGRWDGGFHVAHFTSGLGNMSSVASSAMSTGPRSSGGSGFGGGGGGFGGGGGGFSGGGVGGGGGGGW